MKKEINLRIVILNNEIEKEVQNLQRLNTAVTRTQNAILMKQGALNELTQLTEDKNEEIRNEDGESEDSPTTPSP